MDIKIIGIRQILWFWLLMSFFLALMITQRSELRIGADPEDFCQVSSNESGRFSFQGGGDRQYKSTLPSQFWQQTEERPDPIALNNHLIVQAPTQILASTNCSTNLFGSGINPGATTVDNDLANVGISTGTNATGYALEPMNKSNPTGVQAGTNTGFDNNN